jgi:SecD/SecF fusion protein
VLAFTDPVSSNPVPASRAQVSMLLTREFDKAGLASDAGEFALEGLGKEEEGRYQWMELQLVRPINHAGLETVLKDTQKEFAARPQPERLENFDSQLAKETQTRALYAILASWGAILFYLWFRFGNWTFGLAAVLCLIHDLFFTLGIIGFCHYIYVWWPGLAGALLIQDFKIDLPTVAALLTLVGYSVNDTIVVFDRIREVRGKNPLLTAQMINDSVNQTLSRTLLTSFATWLVVFVLYVWGGEGVHLFAFVMVVGVVVGTYSSIYIASPLLLIFGEGAPKKSVRERPAQAQTAGAV